MTETRNQRRIRLGAIRRERIRAGLEQPTSHGMEGYSQGCQCERCTRANREHGRDVKRQLATKDPAEIPHGLGGYNNYSCRCVICRAAGAVRNADGPKDYAMKAQRATLNRAHRRGQQWTGPEMELLARQDITARQIAEMLGRTYASVSTMRWRLNREPMLDHVAGIGRTSEGAQ